MSGTRAAVFLDRDGTINEEVNFVRSPEQLRLIPGAAEAVRALNDRRIPVCVISNQSGIARGYLSEQDLVAIHARLEEELARAGAHVDRISYCPHHPTEGIPPYLASCRCRKPAPGMLEDAARDLGIDLSGGEAGELCKWFLAAKLFGARIGTAIAIRTYREFERRDVLSPGRILETGWDGLVEILDNGGYVRYDFSTATKLLAIMNDLQDRFEGDLNRLHEEAADENGLENLLKGLGKGIGDVTVNIFLRELRTVWQKARPEIAGPALLAAGRLGLIKPGEEPLLKLERVWSQETVPGKDFCDFEAALVKLGKDYCRKLRCGTCPLGTGCACAKAPTTEEDIPHH